MTETEYNCSNSHCRSPDRNGKTTKKGGFCKACKDYYESFLR